ncbi:MAG: hypothetical protein OHK0013_40540 [Sandaracinaceae bacterium]
MSSPDTLTGRRGTATAIAAIAASVAYVVAGVYERIVAGETDPFLIVRDIHFGYYHRAALAAWIGGTAGLVALRLLDEPGRIARAERALTRATVPLVLALAVVTYLVP